MQPTAIRIAVGLAAGLAAVALLGACGGTAPEEHAGHTTSTTATDQQPADHNADDVSFARNMIPHHQQAVEMAAMAPTNTGNRQVLDLANQIQAAQQPEIQALRAWLLQWGEEVSPGGHGGHGGMAGMVDQPTIDRLKSLTGTEFDKLWLESMIAHHQGAIEMAKAEVANGANQDVKAMANTIIKTQQAEIDRMRQLLGA